MNTLPLFLFVFVLKSFFSFSQNAAANPEAAILPEVLLTFEAVLNDQRVELTWASSAEINNNYFTIEKSKDAIAFEEMTKIKNFGNNSNIISYFDTDNAPYAGFCYYRLTQTDATGRKLSSRIVVVNNNDDNKALKTENSSPEKMEELEGEAKEALVVLRNEKGEESFSKVMVDRNNRLKVSSDSFAKLNNGTYVIIASSDSKLYSKILKIQ